MQKNNASSLEPVPWLGLSRGLLALAWGALLFFHLHFFFFSSQHFRFSFIADDGFYYLLPAKNFFKLGFWSFDKGATLTSGFHLAWAYVLAGLSLFFTEDARLLWAALACSVLITHGAIALAAYASRRSPLGLLVLAFLLSSVNVCQQSVSLVEWPLALLAAGSYALLLSKAPGKSLAPLFWVGLLGSLARSDFGLWPASLATAALISQSLGLGGRYTRSSLVGLLGAALGVGIIFTHNWFMAGSILQGSAEMKLFMAKVRGPNALMAARTLIHLLTGLYALPIAEGSVPFWGKLAFLCAGFGGVFLALFKGFWPRIKERGEAAALFFIASILALAGYHLFYCFDGAVDLWYTSSQAVPCGLLIALSLGVLPMALRRAAVVFLICMCAWNIQRDLCAQAGPYLENDSPLTAGQYLKAHASELKRGRIGSWNAGILNFSQGGDIINLDGLANNEIAGYIIQGKTACYILKKRIAYVVDTDAFTPRALGVWGLSDGKLEAAVISKRRISQSPSSLYPYYLYEIDLKKLEAACP